MTNAPWPDVTAMRDIEARNYYAEATALGLDEERTLAGLRSRSRDNARTPMQWDASAQAGFTTGAPWLPVNPNHGWLNAAAQVGVPGSVFEHYRALIRLRHTEPVVVDGDFTLLLPDDPVLWAFTRELPGQPSLLVVANCSGHAVEVPDQLGGWAGADLVLGNYAEETGSDGLRPWEARVLRRA